jgi:hypothetical protein
VQRGDLGEWGAGEPLERGKCSAQPVDERGGGIKLRLTEVGARIGGMQIGRLPAPQLCEFGVEHRECMRKADGARPRPRAAQDGLFERGDRARVRTGGGAEPRERMLEDSEQGNRRKPAKSDFRRQTGE